MRVNTKVFTERQDMTGYIQIPNCPTTSISGHSMRTVAENIINMLAEPGYAFPSYNSMTILDKILMLHYWREYDAFGSFDDTFLGSGSI